MILDPWASSTLSILGWAGCNRNWYWTVSAWTHDDFKRARKWGQWRQFRWNFHCQKQQSPSRMSVRSLSKVKFLADSGILIHESNFYTFFRFVIADCESAFLAMLLRRLSRMLSQSYQINLLLTGILSSIVQVCVRTSCRVFWYQVYSLDSCRTARSIWSYSVTGMHRSHFS